MAEEKNKTIKSALDDMEYLTGDAEIKRLAELRETGEKRDCQKNVKNECGYGYNNRSNRINTGRIGKNKKRKYIKYFYFMWTIQ